MKKKEVISALIMDVAGGTRSAGEVLTPAYVAKNMDGARAMAIARRYARYRSINPICYQKFYLQYDPNLQVQANTTTKPNNYVLFKLPSVIQIGQENGIRYLGALNCDDSWRIIRSREELSSVNKNSYTKTSNHPGDTYCLYDGNRDVIQIFNNLNIREGLAECIFQNPSENPFYNEQFDDYPADIELIDIMRSILYERFAITKSGEASSQPYEQPLDKPQLPPKNLKFNPNQNSQE